MAVTSWPALDIFTNPVYAGVYPYGRKRFQRSLLDGIVRERMVLAPREEWHAFLIDHHPGYITVEQYEANQARLRANWSAPRGTAATAAAGCTARRAARRSEAGGSSGW